MKHMVYFVTVAFISLLPLYFLEAQQLVGSWQSTDTMSIGRTGHRAVVLNSGEVLVSGGAHEFEYLASCEIYSPHRGRWVRTAAMRAPRYYHTATSLPDGYVLVAGGSGRNAINRTCELYDPAMREWKPTGSMMTARRSHTATLLPEGTVLVTGGDDGENPYSSCELYDTESGQWSATDSMSIARASHTATLLGNGMLLVVGGYTRVGDKQISSATCELFDPETRQWHSTASMHVGRSNHAAVMLNDGRVLVIGGVNEKLGELRSCEIYDPETERWMSVDSVSIQRAGHAAVRLADGKVLVVGGYNSERERTYLSQCEIFDPATGSWYSSAPISNPATTPTLSLLPDGRVLMSGGFSMIQYPLYNYWSHCELFDYSTRSTLSVAREEPSGSLRLGTYPNPASGMMAISYMLPQAEHVSLKLYNALGEEVASLVEQREDAGNHEARFDAGALPAGTYYCRCTAGGITRIRELVISR
jgi:N-acetylneuraminic acid mutarotase